MTSTVPRGMHSSWRANNFFLDEFQARKTRMKAVDWYSIRSDGDRTRPPNYAEALACRTTVPNVMTGDDSALEGCA